MGSNGRTHGTSLFMTRENPYAIANYIRMMRSRFSGVFLVVEGFHDSQLLRQFVDADNSKLKIAHGKAEVLEVIGILNDDQINGVLGIIDADFDRVEKRPPYAVNVISPECHDMDAMLIRTNALAKLLINYGSEEKLDDLQTEPLCELYESARKIASLRLYSERCDLRLKFNGMRYNRFVDPSSLHVDIPNLVRAVTNNSQNTQIDIATAIADIELILQQGYADVEMCTGEDMVQLLSIGLRRRFGSVRNHNLVAPDEIRKFLRMGYHRSEFEASGLFASIQEWAISANQSSIFD